MITIYHNFESLPGDGCQHQIVVESATPPKKHNQLLRILSGTGIEPQGVTISTSRGIHTPESSRLVPNRRHRRWRRRVIGRSRRRRRRSSRSWERWESRRSLARRTDDANRGTFVGQQHKAARASNWSAGLMLDKAAFAVGVVVASANSARKRNANGATAPSDRPVSRASLKSVRQSLVHRMSFSLNTWTQLTSPRRSSRIPWKTRTVHARHRPPRIRPEHLVFNQGDNRRPHECGYC